MSCSVNKPIIYITVHLWVQTMVIQVLWLTEIWTLPFWEMHPLDSSRLFPSTMHLFCLDQVTKLVAILAYYVYHRNITRKFTLSVVPRFWCGCARIFCHHGNPVFYSTSHFQDSFWWTDIFRAGGAIDRWFSIFEIMLCDYFRPYFLCKITSNSTGFSEPKNLKSRTSGDTLCKKLPPSELRLKPIIELKIGVADFGSVLNYFYFPF